MTRAREVYTKILQDRIPQIRDELRGVQNRKIRQ